METSVLKGVGIILPSVTNILFFIPKGKVPLGRTVTYEIFVAEIRPQIPKTHRTQLTIGGDIINFPGDLTTPTKYLKISKLLLNSVI